MLTTDDLFLGGLALTRGGELTEVFVRGTNGRRVAVFRIEGPDVDSAERDYYGGECLVQLQLLKAQVTRLKNVAFDAMRREERLSHAGEQARDRGRQVREPHRHDRR